MAEQQLILVDENDNFLGKYAPKSRCHAGEGLHHRGFTILIYNKTGEVLLQGRRHELWDNVWDLTNSHPLHKHDGGDETYEEASQRCLRREWGIEVPVRKIAGFNYFARYDGFCENEYCTIFVGEHSREVYPNLDVAYGYKWVPIPNLLGDVKVHPQAYTPWLILAVKELSKTRFNLRLCG